MYLSSDIMTGFSITMLSSMMSFTNLLIFPCTPRRKVRSEEKCNPYKGLLIHETAVQKNHERDAHFLQAPLISILATSLASNRRVHKRNKRTLQPGTQLLLKT